MKRAAVVVRTLRIVVSFFLLKYSKLDMLAGLLFISVHLTTKTLEYIFWAALAGKGVPPVLHS